MKIIVLIIASIFPLSCFADSLYINDIPDFMQANIRGEHRGNGQQYCGPVAVSNSITWLNQNKNNQLELIYKLASRQYMNTSLKNGTGTSRLIRGVVKITEELFGGHEKIEYEGWRKHPKLYSSGISTPTLDRIKSAISSRSVAWMNIGWYKYNENRKEYKRIGGHWVTLVGSKHNQLIIHDPSPRAGKIFSNEYINYSIIEKGVLIGNKVGLPFSAKGLISLGVGMHKKKRADYAIVDGVVYLEI